MLLGKDKSQAVGLGPGGKLAAGSMMFLNKIEGKSKGAVMEKISQNPMLKRLTGGVQAASAFLSNFQNPDVLRKARRMSSKDIINAISEKNAKTPDEVVDAVRSATAEKKAHPGMAPGKGKKKRPSPGL